MTRRVPRTLPSALLLLLPALAGSARGGEDPRTAFSFAEGLRERGYYDLAIDYLGSLRTAPDTPPEIKARLDFEEGRAMIDAATHGSDPDRARELLDAAKTRLDAFIKANPNKPDDTVEALVELAHLLYERGHNVAVAADEAKTPADREAKLAEARGYYTNARAAYQQAFERLEAKFKIFPNFIEAGEPLKAEKDRVANAMMNSELQRAVVDYEEAQTYPMDDARRKETLDKTGASFEDVYRRHRTQVAGITARMWQGKCFEERGEFGRAKGIYDELLQHRDPRLLPLQKKVDYFRILLMGKRKEYALAADEAAAWLKTFPNDRRSYEALGIQLELAKDILAQIPEMVPADKDRATKRVADLLADICRVYSPFKAEALSLLNKVAPKAAINADSIGKMTFDDAEAEGTAAALARDYPRANALYRAALRKGTGSMPVDRLNKVRFAIAYSLFMDKRYYEAAALAEHVARRYPGSEWGAKATETGIAAFSEAYNAEPTARPELRLGDLRRLESLAKYAAETWPELEQADMGRAVAGQIALGNGRYDEAIALFDAVRPGSTRKPDALASSGDARWKRAAAIREKDPASKEFEPEATKAADALAAAIAARRSSGAGDLDSSVIANSSDLARIRLELGKPAESLKLLDPIAKTLSAPSRPATLNPAYARLQAERLRAHVALGQVDLAMGDMNAIETTGGQSDDRAQLYYELGTLLEKELANLRKKGDQAALNRTEAAYRKFLGALAASPAGQTFESLLWAGTNLLKLGAADEAGKAFDQILKVYGEDSKFLARPGSLDRLLIVRLRQASALRVKGEFAEADAKVKVLSDENPRSIEIMMEKGQILSARAAAKKGTWTAAATYWQALAGRLKNASPRPVQYFEAYLEAARALQADGKATLAKQTLGGVMRLSPAVGTPEMKARYQDLLSQIK